ncbi:SsgA family sporulation/cell division regulator [Streptomyces sp. NPDC051320]|uniref:SsgA family sporulation/cell division regulator n=1 Tax=Streptomyces sp. NPDC051320 TaxID=3154644 RepID=UPI00341D2D23
MRELVQAEVMMSFLVSEELSFRIPVELCYDVTDPYAIRMTFHLPGDAPVTWTFSRELLLDGINAPTGEGDVHVSPSEPAGLSDTHIRLQVGADRALFRAGSAPLVAFLDRTDKLVPLGQEHTLRHFDGSLDDALGRILAEENAG